MRRAQVVTAACAALMWTAAAGVPMAAAQSGGSGAGSGAGSTQGSNQGGSSTGATAAPTTMGDRDAQTGTGTTATGATDTQAAANDLQQFVQKATLANMAEIQLGQLALQHAQDPQVKQFAQMMVDDHTRALEQLRTVTSSQGLQVPSELDGKHQKLHDKLSKLQGAEFDRAYMDAMVDAHKDAEKLLKSHAGKNGSASASNMGQGGSTAAGNTSSTGAHGTSGATGTTGTSGSTSGSTATGTPSEGAPGTTATTGTTAAAGSSTGASSGTSSAGSTTAPSSADEWAAMTLPKVRAHLEQARSLEDQVKQSAKSNNGNNSGASPAGGPGAGASGTGSTGSGSTSGGTTPPRP